MPGYQSQPVAGFTGHLPGAKWQVGGRYVPPSSENTRSQRIEPERNSHEAPTSNNANYNSRAQEGNLSSMSVEEMNRSIADMKAEMERLQRALSNRQISGEEPQVQIEARQVREEPTRGNPQGEARTTVKQRSRSMPRRVERNPFEGIESGWWSKGEVRRNQQTVEHDIPAAGYSGHIQGLRQVQVGKPFNVAVKQARKDFVERRLASNSTLAGAENDDEPLVRSVQLPVDRF